jgi:hypothetical protein
VESWNAVAQFPGLKDKDNGSRSGSHNTSCKNVSHMVKSEHFSTSPSEYVFYFIFIGGFLPLSGFEDMLVWRQAR